MSNKLKFIITRLHFFLIIFIMFAGFISISLEAMMRIINHTQIYKENSNICEIDFADRYPFPKTEEGSKISNEDYETSEKFSEKYVSLVDSVKKGLTNTKYYVWNYYKYVELKGFIDRIIGINVFEGNTKVVKLNNGRLDWYENEEISHQEIEEIVDTVSDFADYVTNSGKEFLYVQIPCGICKRDPQLPIGVNDYANDNYDKFLQALNWNNIKTIDFRDMIHEAGEEHPSLFFKTDHHWNVDGAFFATKQLVKYLKEMYNYDIDVQYLQDNLYERKVLKDRFLGSEGRKVSKGYVKPEDFELLIPKFDTHLKIEYPALNLQLEGEFIDTIYNWDVLNNENYYEASCYEAQLYGNQPVTHIHNEEIYNELKIMIIRNSFSLGLEPYLSLGVTDIYSIDYRSENGFNGSYRTFFDEYEPDIVILMALPNSENLFQFTEYAEEIQ